MNDGMKQIGGIKRFSDFAKEHVPLDGKKIRMGDILDKEIEITAVKIKQSKYANGKGSAPCLTIQFRLNGEKYITFTGSTVLTDQARNYQHEIPFFTTIKKIDKYYTFT